MHSCGSLRCWMFNYRIVTFGKLKQRKPLRELKRSVHFQRCFCKLWFSIFSTVPFFWVMTYGGGFPATVVCLQMVAARPRSDVRLGFTDLLMQVGQRNFSSWHWCDSAVTRWHQGCSVAPPPKSWKLYYSCLQSVSSKRPNVTWKMHQHHAFWPAENDLHFMMTLSSFCFWC